jgi:hypothetical protein
MTEHPSSDTGGMDAETRPEFVLPRRVPGAELWRFMGDPAESGEVWQSWPAVGADAGFLL